MGWPAIRRRAVAAIHLGASLQVVAILQVAAILQVVAILLVHEGYSFLEGGWDLEVFWGLLRSEQVVQGLIDFRDFVADLRGDGQVGEGGEVHF